MLIKFENIANENDFEHTVQIAASRLYYPGTMSTVRGLSILRHLYNIGEPSAIERHKVNVECTISADRNSAEWVFRKDVPLSDTDGPLLDTSFWSKYTLSVSVVNEQIPAPFVLRDPSKTTMTCEEFAERAYELLQGYERTDWPRTIGQSMKLFSAMYPHNEYPNANHIAGETIEPRLSVHTKTHHNISFKTFLVNTSLGNGFRLTAYADIEEPVKESQTA